ncbi:MAG: hypothetical protein ACOY0T_21090 [Myxococcota bacterium]
MRRLLGFGCSLAIALLPIACGQVLGLKDFKDAPREGEGGNVSASGGTANTGQGGSDVTQTGGKPDVGMGGKADVSMGGSAMPGAGGSLTGMGGAPSDEGGAAGAGGMGTTGGGPALNCAPDGLAQDMFSPPEIDVNTSSQAGFQAEVDAQTLVVVGDAARVHVGIQRTDGQYLVRSLGENAGGPLLVWTKVAGDNHRFTRGRVRAGKLEFYGFVRDSMAVLQVSLGAQGIMPGVNNSGVVETLGRRPCPMDMFPSDFATSFNGGDYSYAVTCENSNTSQRSLHIYEGQLDRVSLVASGDVNDNSLRVQGYVYVPGNPLIHVGDGGSATLRVAPAMAGATPAPFNLDFGTGLAALFGITENAQQNGAQILVASLSNPGLVPATMLWASVPADKFAELSNSQPAGFNEIGVFNSVSEVGEPGHPTAGDWGMWMVGYSKPSEMNTSPTVMRGTWIGPQGGTLVFNQTLRTVQGAEVLRRAYAVRVGLAATYVVWLENVPDPGDPLDPTTPKRHRVRAQRFTCAAMQ